MNVLNLKNLFATLLAFAFSLSTSAQMDEAVFEAYKQDWEKLSKTYENISQMSLDISYILYEDYASKNVMEEMDARVLRNGKDQYTRLGNIETITQDDLTLTVDHDDKLMLLAKAVQNSPHIALGLNTELIARYTDKIESGFTNNGHKYYRIWSNHSDAEKMEIFFDPDNFLLISVAIFYREILEEEDQTMITPTLLLTYGKPTSLSNTEKAKIDIGSYLNKTANGYKPKTRYNNYTLENLYLPNNY